MGSFYQNGLVANLHDFSYGVKGLNNYERLENDLKIFSKKIQWNLFCRVCTQSLKEKLFQK
jgi:hypothetical protein